MAANKRFFDAILGYPYALQYFQLLQLGIDEVAGGMGVCPPPIWYEMWFEIALYDKG